MKPKRSHRRLERDTALSIVRDYHAGAATQSALAERHNLSVGYVHQLVHGDARADVYAQVAAEHREAAGAN